LLGKVSHLGAGYGEDFGTLLSVPLLDTRYEPDTLIHFNDVIAAKSLGSIQRIEIIGKVI
jgi:hypothetical protein